MLPPKLFSRMTREERRTYKDGDVWKNPDHPQGKVVLSEDEIQHVLTETKNGALYLVDKIGFRGLIKRIGFRDLLREMGGVRLAKEAVKSMLRDKNQHYIPIAYRGYWINHHDRAHLDVADLPPIAMADVPEVNGIDGIPPTVVEHFHPDQPCHKRAYNAIYDEYRVAIHQYLTERTLGSKVRLLFYIVRHLPLVPNPLHAIAQHKKSLERPLPTTRVAYPLDQAA